MSSTSLDLSQIKTDALASAATFRTLIGVDLTSYLPLAGGTMTGQLDLDGHAKLGGVSAGVAGIYQADGTTLGTLQAATVDNPSATLTLGNATYGVSVPGAATFSGATSITTSGAAIVPLTINGVAAQSANLQEWKNSAGTIIANVSPTGDSTFDGIYTSKRYAQSYEGFYVYPSGATIRAYFGVGPTATSYLFVQNATMALSFGNSALNQSSVGQTIVNGAAGQYISLRINNAPAVTVNSDLSTTFSNKVTLAAATTSIASMNIPDGVAPTAPSDGDMWCIGDILYRRIGGVTKSITFA